MKHAPPHPGIVLLEDYFEPLSMAEARFARRFGMHPPSVHPRHLNLSYGAA